MSVFKILPNTLSSSAGNEGSHFGYLFRKKKPGSYPKGHQNSGRKAGEHCGCCHSDDILLLLPSHMECELIIQSNFVKTQTKLLAHFAVLFAQHEYNDTS